jgi:hypothetical protein
VSDARRKAGLRPLQGLALAFFIAKHLCTVGRVQVEPDYVPEFFPRKPCRWKV